MRLLGDFGFDDLGDPSVAHESGIGSSGVSGEVDFLTKALPMVDFDKLNSKLDLYNIYNMT